MRRLIVFVPPRFAKSNYAAMKFPIWCFAALLALPLAACGEKPGQVAAASITGYDAAVATEIGYLESGKATPAQALCLRSVRLKADTGVKQVAAADKAGGATAAAVAAAQAAVNELAAKAADPKGC
jgi:hypothetical protein